MNLLYFHAGKSTVLIISLLYRLRFIVPSWNFKCFFSMSHLVITVIFLYSEVDLLFLVSLEAL